MPAGLARGPATRAGTAPATTRWIAAIGDAGAERALAFDPSRASHTDSYNPTDPAMTDAHGVALSDATMALAFGRDPTSGCAISPVPDALAIRRHASGEQIRNFHVGEYCEYDRDQIRCGCAMVFALSFCCSGALLGTAATAQQQFGQKGVVK